MDNIKLGIGLPLTDKDVPTQFLDSFVLMEKPAYVYMRPQFPSYTVADIRNQLVQQALESGCTHVLMMDTDQVYPSNTISKLLSYDKDVVSAIVHRRYPPFDAILYRGEPGRYIHVSDEDILEAKNDNELIEIDATGCGCVLYKTEVFLKIDPPWFEFGRDFMNNVVGEDIGFCHKLRTNGYKIYCDPTINIGHLSLLEVNWDTYTLYKHLKKIQENNGG